MPPAAPWWPREIGPVPDVALWNAVVSHLGARLPLHPPAEAVVSAGQEPAADTITALVRFGEGAWFIAAPAVFPFRALLGAALETADLPLLPAVLRDALLDGMQAALLSALPGHRDGPARVAARGHWADLEPAGPARSRLRWFRAELRGVAPEPALVDIGLDPIQLQGLLSPSFGARRLWAGLEDRLTRAADETLGRLALDPARLAALHPGAVVVLERTFDPGRHRLRVGASAYDFSHQGEAWLCVGLEALDLAHSGDRFPMLPDDATPARAPTSVGAIDVAVDFDLGRLDVPLAAIESWQPGSLVGLPPPLLAEGVAVTLRVNGRAIGSGDLVRIDDRIAVRLTDVRLGG